MKLTARQKTIVNYFLSKDMSSDIYVSSNVLAKMFAVSYKTIQKDMNDLTLLLEHNPCGLRLITKPGLGYTIKKMIYPKKISKNYSEVGKIIICFKWMLFFIELIQLLEKYCLPIGRLLKTN